MEEELWKILYPLSEEELRLWRKKNNPWKYRWQSQQPWKGQSPGKLSNEHEDYEGDIVNGLAHGYGFITNKTREWSYIGSWFKGKQHNYGVLKTKGDVYSGQFFNDLQNGITLDRFSDGDCYLGYCLSNKKHGFGIYFWSENQALYIGEYQQDKWNGIAVSCTNDERLYFGQWFQGERCGYGIYFFPDGSIYEGHWKQKQRYNLGTMYFAQGGSVTCLWLDDAPYDVDIGEIPWNKFFTYTKERQRKMVKEFKANPPRRTQRVCPIVPLIEILPGKILV